MTKESVSILGALVNLFLAVLKLAAGFFIKSAALIADGIHSGLDIISSAITFLGIKVAKKPADKEHPYGHLRYETISAFVVVLLLVVSAIWIIYEGILSIIGKEPIQISVFAIVIVIFSIIVNEIMAQLKFKIGRKTDNLVLIADGQHSRADSISSIAVLVGLIASYWFVLADGLAAVLVGLYIFYQTYFLSREVVDSLLDIANPEIEKQIKEICLKQEIELLGLKTRKIGPQNFAELEIGLAKDWKMQKVDKITSGLEDLFRKEIPNLGFVVIQVKTHELKRGYIKLRIGQIKSFKELSSKVSLKKKGWRKIIPLGKDNKVFSTFGSPKYLIIDEKDKKIVQKKIIENPYFVIGRGHGVRLAREIEADEIISVEIGQHAKESLENLGMKIKTATEEEINSFIKK